MAQRLLLSQPGCQSKVVPLKVVPAPFRIPQLQHPKHQYRSPKFNPSSLIRFPPNDSSRLDSILTSPALTPMQHPLMGSIRTYAEPPKYENLPNNFDRWKKPKKGVLRVMRESVFGSMTRINMIPHAWYTSRYGPQVMCYEVL